MNRTVVGLFDHTADAEAAVRDLLGSGYPRDDISVLRSQAAVVAAEERGPTAADGAAAGAGLGALLGAVAGLTVFAIPGVGAVAGLGWLASALVGAAVGAGAGGLMGALAGAGVPEEEAYLYEEGVRRGGTLVSLRTDESRADEAVRILNRHNPVDIRARGAEWRSAGWTFPVVETATSTAAAGVREVPVAAAPSTDFDRYNADFRRDFEASLSGGPYTWDQARAAYRYGLDLAQTRQGGWDAIEPEARRGWEERNPGTWDRFKGAARYGFELSRVR